MACALATVPTKMKTASAMASADRLKVYIIKQTPPRAAAHPLLDTGRGELCVTL